MDELSGKRFGKEEEYEVLHQLGKGGMGTVYLARDHRHERLVAMKFLGLDGSVNKKRFVREAREFGGLRHPNLIRLYNLRQEQEHLYIVSEFIEGNNLLEMLDRDGVFSVERASSIGRDVATGLAEVHRNRCVHRDLKPENVMVRGVDGAVKVLDFGIAKALDASSDLTRPGEYVGTPGFSAPEQIRDRATDGRTDVFALGALLYELLTGQMAFRGETADDVLTATLRDDPIPIARLNASVPPSLVELIDRMLQKRPRRRPADMDEVIAALG